MTHRIGGERITKKTGITKFYTLWPRWVWITLHQLQCVCTYCASFKLTVITAIASVDNRSWKTPQSLWPHDKLMEAWQLQECQECCKGKGLTFGAQRLNVEDEVTVAPSESGGLIKKMLSGHAFIKDAANRPFFTPSTNLYTRFDEIWSGKKTILQDAAMLYSTSTLQKIGPSVLQTKSGVTTSSEVNCPSSCALQKLCHEL